MEEISALAEKVMQQQGQHLSTPNNKSKTLEILRKPSNSVTQNGIDAFLVVDSPMVSATTFTKAIAYLQQAYGIDYPKEKFSILFDLIMDDGWSEERFSRTLKWFLKTKYNQAWTIADWFQYGVKLFPFSWVREHCNKNGLREVDFVQTLDVYMVDGIRLYKFADGVELPLTKLPNGGL